MVKLTKNLGLAKFQLNFKRHAVLFFEQFFLSRSLEFYAKVYFFQYSRYRFLDFFVKPPGVLT